MPTTQTNKIAIPSHEPTSFASEDTPLWGGPEASTKQKDPLVKIASVVSKVRNSKEYKASDSEARERMESRLFSKLAPYYQKHKIQSPSFDEFKTGKYVKPASEPSGIERMVMAYIAKAGKITDVAGQTMLRATGKVGAFETKVAGKVLYGSGPRPAGFDEDFPKIIDEGFKNAANEYHQRMQSIYGPAETWLLDNHTDSIKDSIFEGAGELGAELPLWETASKLTGVSKALPRIAAIYKSNPIIANSLTDAADAFLVNLGLGESMSEAAKGGAAFGLLGPIIHGVKPSASKVKNYFSKILGIGGKDLLKETLTVSDETVAGILKKFPDPMSQSASGGLVGINDAVDKASNKAQAEVFVKALDKMNAAVKVATRGRSKKEVAALAAKAADEAVARNPKLVEKEVQKSLKAVQTERSQAIDQELIALDKKTGGTGDLSTAATKAIVKQEKIRTGITSTEKAVNAVTKADTKALVKGRLTKKEAAAKAEAFKAVKKDLPQIKMLGPGAASAQDLVFWDNLSRLVTSTVKLQDRANKLVFLWGVRKELQKELGQGTWKEVREVILANLRQEFPGMNLKQLDGLAKNLDQHIGDMTLTGHLKPNDPRGVFRSTNLKAGVVEGEKPTKWQDQLKAEVDEIKALLKQHDDPKKVLESAEQALLKHDEIVNRELRNSTEPLAQKRLFNMQSRDLKDLSETIRRMNLDRTARDEFSKAQLLLKNAEEAFKMDKVTEALRMQEEATTRLHKIVSASQWGKPLKGTTESMQNILFKWQPEKALLSGDIESFKKGAEVFGTISNLLGKVRLRSKADRFSKANRNLMEQYYFHKEGVGELRGLSDGRTVLYLSNAAMDALQRATHPFAFLTTLRGIQIPKKDVQKVLDRLDVWVHNSTFKEPLKELIKKTVEKTKEPSIILSRKVDRLPSQPKPTFSEAFSGRKTSTISTVKDTVREELAHQWQGSFTEGEATKHLDGMAMLRIHDQIPKEAIDYLKGNGYNVNDLPTVVIETTAKIIAGDSKKLGLTDEKAVDLLYNYFTEIRNQHGEKALEKMRYIHANARKARAKFEPR